MKVTFVPTKDHVQVEIFVDGAHVDTRKVQKTEDGHEYINVPNLLRPDGGILEKHSFLHRIGDMVTHIRRGWGDCVEVSHLLVRTEHLAWFLDRKYGETMRAKSIEGWKDAKFAWAVFMEDRTFGDWPINVLGETVNMFIATDEERADTVRVQYYDTEKEAQAFINGILDELRPITEKYRAIAKSGDEKASSEFYDKYLNPLTGIRQTVWLRCRDDKIVDDDCCLYAGQIARIGGDGYRTMPVFRNDYSTVPGWYICRGDAVDSPDDFDSPRPYIVESDFATTATDDEIFKGDSDERTIYRAEFEDTVGKWYLSVQECFDGSEYATIAKEAKAYGENVMIHKSTLHKQENQPVEVSEEQPYDMLLSVGSKGLLGYANLRPDEVGKYGGRKKIYFPDRGCKDKLCAGMVRVTKVNDRGNYGFITGEMIKYSSPEEGALADWLIEQGCTSIAITLRFVENPKWGSAVMLTTTGGKSGSWAAVDKNGKLATYDILDEYDHEGDIIREECDARDFICTGYAGKSFGELCSIVPYVEAVYRMSYTKSIKYISDAFDEAVDCGVIDFRRYGRLDVCVMEPDWMCKAAQLLQQDLIPVLEEAKRINEEAIERLTNMKRKGKI